MKCHTAQSLTIKRSSSATKVIAKMTQSMTDEFGLADAMKQIATFKSKDLRFMTLKSLELKGLGKQDSAAIHSRIW